MKKLKMIWCVIVGHKWNIGLYDSIVHDEVRRCTRCTHWEYVK